MTTVGEQLQSTNKAICRNIESLADQRPLLSQNLLSQLRNLVEGVAVRLQTGSPNAEFTYAAIESGQASADMLRQHRSARLWEIEVRPRLEKF
jgi:hypothetical protein